MLRWTPNRFEGFTLIELLVVLVILGFLAVLIPPRFNSLMTSTQAKAATRDLISELRSTRSSAISQQQEKVLLLNMEEKSFSFDAKKPIKLPEKMQVSLYTARSEQISEQMGGIRFFPDGSSTGGRIRLIMEKQTFYIDINWLTGKVALLDNVDPDKWKSADDGFASVN